MTANELPAVVTNVTIDRAVQAAADAAPEMAGLLRLAIEQRVPVDTLERLLTMHERIADRQAAKDFASALAEFQRECPPIAKTSTATRVKGNGTEKLYNYAELDEIARTIGPLLHTRGLAYSWDSSWGSDRITCVCKLRHANGHSETATFSCVTTAASPLMNAQQREAAALTYAKRQSLVQVLGLTTTEPDTDAEDSHEKISKSQAADVEAMIAEVGASLPRIYKWLSVKKIADVRVVDHARLIQYLNSLRKEGGK